MKIETFLNLANRYFNDEDILPFLEEWFKVDRDWEWWTVYLGWEEIGTFSYIETAPKNFLEQMKSYLYNKQKHYVKEE